MSREQVAYAKERYAYLPIDIRLDDYRKVSGRYDAVVSIGLMEHVGPKNYRGYMEQAIDVSPPAASRSSTRSAATTAARIDPWFDKYIFPNSAIPSLAQLTPPWRASSSPRTSRTSARTTTPR